MSVSPEIRTPWQKVFAKFRMSRRALGREIGRDGAKISLVLRDPKGLINGRDQEELLKAAKRLGVDLAPEDLLPPQ